MKKSKVRVRFAPSPTGMMHLGNVRTALMNYIFAKQKNGISVLRIEDTDPERNFDPGAKHIIKDLQWLDLHYDEGPSVRDTSTQGPFKPYFQSKRLEIYQEKLNILIKNKQVYRCFCTQEELEKKRQRQIALKMPPRYDRTCLDLSDDEIQKKLDSNIPFIWRVKLDHKSKITINDIAHKNITFDLKNFSDFPITRQNGTFTFMFANFVDDMVMKISHVLRGEDHLSNTAGQVALYKTFNATIPTFWHMPILCNLDGKKLSKRDFGFSLNDLKNAGYLPEAICNYLAIIGGSFEKEIMSLDELSKAINFDHLHAKGQIKYDVEKLRWVNHKWIDRYDSKKLYEACLPYLQDLHEEIKKIPEKKLEQIIQIIKTDLITLNDIKKTLEPYFIEPEIKQSDLIKISDKKTVDTVSQIIQENIKNIENSNIFLSKLKSMSKQEGISIKALFSIVRIGLMGSAKGPGISELIEILGTDKTKKRIEKLLETINKTN